MLLMLSEKGKYASATQNRRFVWSEIVWPLILEINDVAFTLKQYQKKRDEICAKKNIDVMTVSRGLASLLQRGIIRKEKDIYYVEGESCTALHVFVVSLYVKLYAYTQ